SAKSSSTAWSSKRRASPPPTSSWPGSTRWISTTSWPRSERGYLEPQRAHRRHLPPLPDAGGDAVPYSLRSGLRDVLPADPLRPDRQGRGRPPRGGRAAGGRAPSDPPLRLSVGEPRKAG